MSEDQKQKGPMGGLNDFMERVRNGVGQMNAKKPSREAEPSLDEADPILTEPSDAMPENGSKSRPVQSPLADEDDVLLLDEKIVNATTEHTETKPSRKKALIMLGILVAAIVVYKNMGGTSTDPVNEGDEVHQTINAESVDQGASDFNDWSLPGEVPGQTPSAAQADDAVGQTLNELQLNGPLQVLPTPTATPSGENALLSKDVFQAAPVNTPLEFLPADKAEATFPSQPQANVFEASENALTSSAPEPEAESENLLAAAGEKGDMLLSGTPSEKPDSTQKPSLQVTDSELSVMKAQVQEQQAEIAKLKQELVKAKQTPQPAPKPRTTPAAALIPKAVANAPSKVGKRPKICVKAVAPPARNCSTCVAHAFLVNENREEIMVGQGDYLSGYRVSIIGDRLDLQNSAGEVVHKFWSQVSGCATI